MENYDNETQKKYMLFIVSFRGFYNNAYCSRRGSEVIKTEMQSRKYRHRRPRR